MLRKTKILIVLISVFLNYQVVFAASATPMLCSELTGTWEGWYLDNGPYEGRVSVRLSLQSKNNNFIGQTLPIKSKKVSFMTAMIQGQCSHNTLKLYFFTQYPELCGSLSTGKIKNFNNIHIDVQWENAMTGGQGPMRLVRVNQQYVGKRLPFPEFPQVVDSCH